MARPYTTISFGLVLAGLVLIFQAANGDVYYVASNVSDCKNVDANTSCNTLDHYVNSTTLRINDTVLFHAWETPSTAYVDNYRRAQHHTH